MTKRKPATTEKLSARDRKGILKAREFIFDSFDWSQTKQHSNYWLKVYKNLIELERTE